MSSVPSSAAVRLRCASSLFVLAAALAGGGSAWADEDAAAPTQVDQVVVTATKRPERSKDVPIALSAFGPAELTARDPRGILDLATALPNVQLTGSGNTLFVDPVIRGISSSPRNAGVESGLAVYVDGVYTGRPETFDTGLEDARTVEVLRGPQGTLFGKNAIAGALSVTTNDPTPDYSGRLNVQFGSQDESRLSGVLNAPLGPKAAVRLTLFRERRDGYVKNLFGGSTVGDDNYWGGRLKAKIELAPSLDLVLAADGRRDDRHPYFGEIPGGVNPVSPTSPQPVVAPGDFTINEDHRPDSETRDLWGVSGTITYHAAGGFSLSAISAWRDARHRFTEDNDSSPLDAVFNDFVDRQKQFTQELRLVSPDGGRLTYAAGLYYFRQNAFTRHTGGLGADFAIPGLVPGGVVKTVEPSGRIATRSYAAYVDGSYRLTQTLDLLAGLRVTQETKHVTFGVAVDPVLVPLFFPIPQQHNHRQETDLSPTIGLRYRPSEELTAYAKLSRGYKSGGWNLDFIGRVPGAPAPTLRQLGFRPEKVTNYEAGLKGDVLEHRLGFDFAAFYMDYQNLQVTQFFGLQGGAVTSNAAAATLKGVEGDLTAVVAPGLTIGATAGYNDARYDRFKAVNAAGDAADGKRLPGPRVSASFNAGYSFTLPFAPGGFFAFAEYAYRGSGFVTPLNERRLEIPGRSLANARLSWTVERWKATVFVENLFDNRYIEAVADDPFATPANQVVSFGRPRSGGVSLSRSF